MALRQSRRLGPARLAGIVGVPASTVHRVLVRHGVNRLRWMDRPTGRVIRRIETSRCGELVHIDVKKLARIPDGGGHRSYGRTGDPQRLDAQNGVGYTHIHTAIDAYSRLAYSEFAGDENTVNCVAFLDRAVAWFADPRHHHRTDPHRQRQRLPQPRLAPTAAPSSASSTPAPSPTTPPPTARSNASTAPWPTNGPTPDSGNQNAADALALDRFLHRYNHHRHHTAIGGPPITRVTNLAGHNS